VLVYMHCSAASSIVVATLALLLRDSKVIREGGPARAGYEFLVGCYKPQFFY
jgi:hypothetical protein